MNLYKYGYIKIVPTNPSESCVFEFTRGLIRHQTIDVAKTMLAERYNMPTNNWKSKNIEGYIKPIYFNITRRKSPLLCEYLTVGHDNPEHDGGSPPDVLEILETLFREGLSGI